MNYAVLLNKLSVEADLRAECPTGQCHIQGDKDKRALRVTFSNKSSFRYALRMLPAHLLKPASYQSFQKISQDADLQLDLRVGNQTVMRLAPDEQPKISWIFLARQLLQAKLFA